MAKRAPSKFDFRFQDVVELNETFVDSVRQWHVDGSTLRIDFLTTRFDETKSPDTRTERKCPFAGWC